MKLVPAPHPDYAAPDGAGSSLWVRFYNYVAPPALQTAKLNGERGQPVPLAGVRLHGGDIGVIFFRP